MIEEMKQNFPENLFKIQSSDQQGIDIEEIFQFEELEFFLKENIENL